MSKQDIVDYVMETPQNTNKTVLEGLVDSAIEESLVQLSFKPFKVTMRRIYGIPYLDKTPKEIYDAYNAGKYVYLENDSCLFPLTSVKCFDDLYTISFSGTYKVNNYNNICVASLSVKDVSPTYSERWTENYKYHIDSKIFELSYNLSTNQITGTNPCDEIRQLVSDGQLAVIRLLHNNNAPDMYLYQTNISEKTNEYIFISLDGNDGFILMLIITPDSMRFDSFPISLTPDEVVGAMENSFVSFETTQTLTTAQKELACENIGARSLMCTITGSGTEANPYVCDKTYDEISTAVSNGQIPYCIYDSGSVYGNKKHIFPYLTIIVNPSTEYVVFAEHLLNSTDGKIYSTQIYIEPNGEVNFTNSNTNFIPIVNSINGERGDITLKTSDLENDSNYITAEHVYDGVLISSSTPDSTKKFKITVDDTGALTATEVTETE